MSKKEIALVVIILLIIAGIAFGSFVAWRHYSLWKTSKDRIETVQNATPASDAISLQQQNSPSSLDSSALKVDASANSSNAAQLGSGRSTTNSSVSSAASSSSQGLDTSTFNQYDKYKDATDALFAEMQLGDGAEVKANTKVAVTYKGWLTNGTLFDQSQADSAGKLQPLVFTVGAHQVVPGFEQDVVGMKVGGTRLFIIPPKAGYGDKAQGGIPANSVLIFQVTLVDAL